MGKYSEQYKQIHKTKRYGVSGEGNHEKIKENRPQKAYRVLDYGCGQGDLLGKLEVAHPVYYDPNVEGRDTKPEGLMDWIICTDVMEHIPEEELDEVLTDIFSYGNNVFMMISLALAHEILPNGDNAHCTVKPAEWWLDLLSDYTEHVNVVPTLTNRTRLTIKTY